MAFSDMEVRPDFFFNSLQWYKGQLHKRCYYHVATEERANANELKPERFRSGSNRSVLHPAGFSLRKSAWIARNEAEV